MKGLRRHPFRVAGRLCRFAAEILIAVLDYLFHCAGRRKKFTLAAKSLWLQRVSRRQLRAVKIEVQAAGPVPSRGLLVCNHLSYLDILVIASLTPAVFVAKREIKNWPVIGWFTQLAGTLFIDRQRRMQVGRMKDDIQAALDQGALVVLFPEGTSSDGRTVLPFKSSLLEPATGTAHPLFAGRIHYELDDGDVGREVCYWGNHRFVPHLLNLLGLRSIRVLVRFARFEHAGLDRKELARRLNAEVSKLNSEEKIGAHGRT